ncbi:MAG: LysM peptidoglycan-binding domain-containing protein [Phycisphaerales bacterium]|nr:MAG: LysM peptidoglycan-binding domain-containing protein [Phycisphaerales bacterium]
MASNVKIGLLLSLVLIFVIAFLIGGLRRGDNTPSSGESITAVLNESRGILPEVPPEVLPPVETDDSIESTPPNRNADRDSQIPELKPVEPAWSGPYYIVRKGDNLGDIAKKLYGPEEGNRTANVARIFEANRRLLKSPDEIHVGQELIVPPLKVTEPDQNTIEGLFPSSMFEQVESIGRKHIRVGGADEGIRATAASVINDR